MRTAATSAASRAAAKASAAAETQTARLRENRLTGRALTSYERYYALSLHDAGSAVVYYATLALFPVLILAYLLLAWLSRRHPDKFQNADQNLADSLGISADKVSSLFSAQAHAAMTAFTTIIGSIGVAYAAWAWMDTYDRALRKVWETDADPVAWRRVLRDSLAALVGIPLMFLAFAVSGMSVTHLSHSIAEYGFLSWRLLAAGFVALLAIAASTALFSVVCQQTFRRLGGATPGAHLWVASTTAGLGLAGMSVGAQILLRQTISNPYGIVMNILGLMLWVSVSIRMVLSAALWAAEDARFGRSSAGGDAVDGDGRETGGNADPGENQPLTAF